MATWPANGVTDWNTEMLAYLAVGHDTDGTHNEAGLTRQVVNTQTGAVASNTTQIPYDDSIPQITEGSEYMTLAVTPTNVSNKLKIDIVFNLSVATGNRPTTVALFQDATANALAAIIIGSDYPPRPICFTHYMAAGTTSETTFRVRAGTDGAAALTFNGAGAARKLGGVLASSITITEIQV